MASDHVHHVAHHWLLLAGPAFLPAVVVVAVVLYVAIKDRRTPPDGDDAERSDAEKRRHEPDGDDAEPSAAPEIRDHRRD